MLDQTDELAQGLRTLADSAPPAAGGGIDIARAMRTGRVRLRRRRFTVYGAAVAVVATATTVALLPTGDGGDRILPKPVPVATRTPAAPTPDPLVVEASFGWLPAGFDGFNYLPDHGRTVIRADGKAPEGGSFGPTIWLQVYPAGTTPSTGKPWYPGGPRQYRVGAPPVNGRTAYWVGKAPTAAWAPGGDWYLRWQTADGRWAEMNTTYLAGTDAQQILHRIAEGVVVAPKPIPLPFRIGTLPAAFKISTAAMEKGTTMLTGDDLPWTSSIGFMVDGMPVQVVIEPDRPASPKGTPDPHLKRIPGPKQTCLTSRGIKICTESQYGVNAYRRVGGPAAFLKKFTLLGPDQKKWTTDVLG